MTRLVLTIATLGVGVFTGVHIEKWKSRRVDLKHDFVDGLTKTERKTIIDQQTCNRNEYSSCLTNQNHVKHDGPLLPDPDKQGKGDDYCFQKYIQNLQMESSLNTDSDNTRTTSDSWSKFLSDVLGMAFPTVHASTKIIPKDNQQTPKKQVMQNSSRLVEVMKHGFPSLDNIRSHGQVVLSYDQRLRIPKWVFEHITPRNLQKSEKVSRDNCQFQSDDSIHQFFRSTNDDYKNSGYDRGHLAAAGNYKHDQQAMEKTFVLSNISPQVGKGFNRDAWNTLEKYTRYLAKQYVNTYICSGPLFLPRMENSGRYFVTYQVIGHNHVAVPTHFFKVIVGETKDNRFDLYSFVMPNQALPVDVNIKSYYVPIESIERAAGFLLFDKINRNLFNKINEK